MRLREFKERQRLDENPLAILLPIFGLISSGAAMLSQPKIEKWVKDNPGEAKNFADGIKKVVPDGNPQAITNPIGNALVKSWNWLTNGETQKDSVIKNQPPLSVPFKDRPKKDAQTIQNKITYDQYLNTVGQKAKPDPKVIQNIRSSGDAGAGWAKQYDDLYKKRSQVNKQIAADIKNGMTKDQLDSKYGDNLQNINRDLNDHLGKVDGLEKSKTLKDLPPTINVKPVITKPLDIKNNNDGTVTINGKTYDKDFDKQKIADIKRRQQGQISKSIGSGSAGAVSGGKDKGKDGGALGGNIGTDIPWDGGVSGSSSKGKSIGSTDKGDGTITGPEIGVKGQTGVGQGTASGTKGEVIPGTNIGTNTVTGANTIAGNPAIPIGRTTIPPGFLPPPIAQLPLAKQTRKFDPTKDKGNIIYKGKVAPDAVSKFKATKSNPQKNKDYYKKLIQKFS